MIIESPPISVSAHRTRFGFCRGLNGRITVRLVCRCLLVLITVTSCSSDKRVTIPLPSVVRGGDFYPAWSPSGETIAFLSEDFDTLADASSLYLKTIDTKTASVDTLISAKGMGINGIDWSPDGRWLVLSAGPGIFKILSNGDSLTQLTEGLFHVSPSWSRVTERIFYADNAGDDMGIYSIEPDGSNLTQWTPPTGTVPFTAPRCFPDSDTLTGFVYHDNHRCIALYFPGDSDLISMPLCELSWVWAVKMSPTKQYIAFNANLTVIDEVHLYLIDRSGGSLRELVDGQTDDFAISPDGSRIVYPDLEETRGLQIIDLATNRISQLTSRR